MSIKAEGLSHFYDHLPALEAVDLEVGTGELIVLCGRNGSGKSTLLKCLAGLQKPSRGSVTIDGLPAEKARHRVGLAIQFPERALFEKTVYDDVAFLPKNLGLRPDEVQERVAKASVAVGLSEDLLAQPHGSLSYGQKRLAGLACILSGSPACLFLDEPTAGLDYPGRQRIRGLLRNQSRSGVTIVVATHDPSFFAGICSRLIVLKAGRIAFDGAPEEADLAEVGIRSDTLELALRLRSCGLEVRRTFSPEELADSIAEAIR